MNITVSARIGAGFALMLLLLLGLLITGLTAIGNVNDSLNVLAHQTTPRMAYSGQLQSHFQAANILVLRHYQNDALGELGPLESQLQSELQTIDSVNDKLRGLASGSGAFKSQLEQLDIAGVASAAKATQAAHRQALEQADQVARQVRAFTDMADEVESNLLDLPANAPGKTIGNQLYETLTGTNKLALKALDNDISAAVKSASRQIDSRLKKADSQWQALQNAAGNTKPVEAIRDAYQRYKAALTGDQGVLAGYQTQLQLQKDAQSTLIQLLELTDANAEAVSQLVAISRANAEEHANGAEATVAGSQWLLWLFFLVAMVAAGLTGVYIVRSIKHPLNQIVAVIRNLAAGDLRDSLSLSTNDELGELAQHTNTLAEQLRSAIGQISENAESLALAAQNGSDIADRNNRTAQAQKDQTIQFANAMREMVTTVRDVASSASHTLSKVKEAKQRTEGGRRVVDENIESIEQLAAEIANAAQVIDKLNERSTNISSVLEVIREIANQTNLLALNAAIEAARAGEQGRGFAVVADEVRTLASRTQDSTTEIQAMIEKLQTEARQAVTVMEKSRAQAGEGVEKSSMAGVELGAIDGAMDEINSMSIQIATASEEQSQVSTEMQRNIEEVSSLADSTAAAAQEGLSTSAELNQLASGMRTLVAKFSF